MSIEKVRPSLGSSFHLTLHGLNFFKPKVFLHGDEGSLMERCRGLHLDGFVSSLA